MPSLAHCCHCIAWNSTNFGGETEDHVICCTQLPPGHWLAEKPSSTESSRMGISKAKISLWIYSGQPSGVGGASTVHPQDSKSWCNQTPQGRKGKKQPLLKASLSPLPQLRSVLIPCSTSPQTRGKPDSLPITVISHPYMWLWSVEKETGLIFQ